jgi:hypothetical protein
LPTNLHAFLYTLKKEIAHPLIVTKLIMTKVWVVVVSELCDVSGDWFLFGSCVFSGSLVEDSCVCWIVRYSCSGGWLGFSDRTRSDLDLVMGLSLQWWLEVMRGWGAVVVVLDLALPVCWCRVWLVLYDTWFLTTFKHVKNLQNSFLSRCWFPNLLRFADFLYLVDLFCVDVDSLGADCGLRLICLDV